MSGIKDYNFPAFFEAADRLRRDGFDVWNPAEHDVQEDGFDPTTDKAKSFPYYMLRDLPEVMASDGIAVLPGWQQSKGASLEVRVATDCGLPIYDAMTGEPYTETVLDEAQRLVHGARRHDYGTPFENHSRTAALWSAYLQVSLSPEQVCFLNILQKISRSVTSVTRDTLVDIAGYAANVELVQQASPPVPVCRCPGGSSISMVPDMPGPFDDK